jgi:hypothetical protein
VPRHTALIEAQLAAVEQVHGLVDAGHHLRDREWCCLADVIAAMSISESM